MIKISKKIYTKLLTHPNQISNFIRDFMQLRAKSFYKQATDKNYKELYANFKSLFKV